MQLYRKYRPKDLNGIAGQKKVVDLCRIHEQSGYGGKSFWITGKSGRGKTTIANIIALKVSKDTINIQETTGRELTKTILQEFTNLYKLYGKPLIGGGYTLIINESHGLNKVVIESLLNTMESLPSYVSLIFTTTLEGDTLFEEEKMDASPFKSRCIVLALTDQGNREAFTPPIFNIAFKEGLTLKEEEREETERKIKRLLQENRGNFRSVLVLIEGGGLL